MTTEYTSDKEVQEAVDLFYQENRQNIKGSMLFLALHGSRAYGSAHEDSDVDLSGVFIAPMDDLLGLRNPQGTFDRQSTDFDIYMHEVGKFFDLARKGNPNAIEVLWGPPIEMNPHFQTVIDNRDQFLSQQFISRCKGFANAQLGRINRKSGKLHNHKRMKHAFHIVRLLQMALQVANGEPTDDLIKVKNPEGIREMLREIDDEGLKQYMESLIQKIDSTRHSSSNSLPQQPNFNVLNQMLIDLRHEIENDALAGRTTRLVGEDTNNVVL